MLQYANERKKQQEQRRRLNKEMEIEAAKEKKRLKETSNPWERIVSQVEINASQYVGPAEVSRMRQAMLARKSDITKSSSGGAAAGKKFTM